MLDAVVENKKKFVLKKKDFSLLGEIFLHVGNLQHPPHHD